MKVTVQHRQNSLDYINVGEKIVIEKEGGNTSDPKALKAIYEKQFIGYVSVSGTTIAPGSTNGHELFDIMDHDTIEGTVESMATLTNQKTGSSRIGLVINVSTGTETQDDPIYAEGYNFTFKVKGSATKYPGKSIVLTDVKDKNLKTFVDLKINNDDKVVVFRQNGEEDQKPAGIVDEKALSNCSSMEDLDILKELLRNNTDLEAKVSKVTGASYFINLQISADVIDNCRTVVAKASIDMKKQELIDKGFDAELLNEIEEYLTSCEFSATDIEALFNTYKVYPEEVQSRIIKKPETLFKDTFGAMKVLWAAAANGYHVLESGDRGTGKNVAVETFAWLTQRPLYTMSISSETDKLDLLGSKTINAEVENNNVINSIQFEPELVLEAMANDGILNLDEVNFGSPAVLGVLHSVMDTRREINAPGYGNVSAGNNFMVICTINENYLGTNSLNEAFRDRMINLRFPNNSSIYEVLKRACPSAKKSDIQKVDKVYQKMYSIIQQRDSSLDEDCITVRGPIQALNMAPILGLKAAMKVAMIKTQDAEYAANIESLIDNII